VYRGIACRLRLKVILRLAEREAGFYGDDFACSGGKLRMGIDAGSYSRAAKRKFLQAFGRVLNAVEASSICRA
jgi:hypothetical protein